MGYTNSPLAKYKRISPNRTSPRNHAIDTITPHCFVGQASVEDMCAWLSNTSAQASANYVIGADGRVGLNVEEQDRSWCSSSRDNDNRAVTIECASDKTDPYAINAKVYATLIELMVDICRRNGKTKLTWPGTKEKYLAYRPKKDEMLLSVHRWYANKACPGDYIYSRLGKIASEVTDRLGGKPAQQEEEVHWYRVRKTWKDEKSQLGAYHVLQNAKDNCPAGYVVFDDNGKAVYTPDTPDVYSPEEWFAEIAPIAVNLAEKNRILPSVVIAQTYLETGCGTTDLTGKRNIIGMKADLINNTWISVWDGKKYVKKTPEYVNGQLIYKEDTFRVYRSFAQCLEDYEAFLLGVQNGKGHKYRRIQGWTDPANVINAIRIGTGTNDHPEGYCTDPNYETKILNIISQFNLTKYDAVMKETATTAPTTGTTAPTTKDKYVVRKSFSDSKSQTNSFNSLDNAKKEADKYGYTVYEAATGKAVYTPAAAVKDKYAVRHNIDDKAYQLGLFHDLSNAKKLADQNWGYKVYDITTGKCVYEPKLTKAQKLVAECVWMDLIVRDDIKIGRIWTYKNKNTKKLSRTFDDARKEYNFKTNCSTAVYWALLRSKVVNSNRDGIQWNGNDGFVWLNDHAKKDALKYFHLISVRDKTVRKCISDGTLQPGDVISFVNLAHTCIYLGQGLTYDTGHHNCSGSGEGAKFKCWASKAGYANYRVAEILRPK